MGKLLSGGYTEFYQRFRDPPDYLPSRYKTDIACFALWEGALANEKTILDDIRREFEIIGNFEIEWTKEHYESNIARLYRRPHYSAEFSGFHRKIGKPPFRFIMVKDNQPEFGWWRSVSGDIEMTNLNVVRAKHRYRGLFEERYMVHSSANARECLAQAALLLGPETLRQLLATQSPVENYLKKDLEGAGGWESWEAFLDVMQFCSEFVMLRGFEAMPEKHEGADIDFLCNDLQFFASSADVAQREGRPHKGTITVREQSIPVDVRFVGDGYYPSIWEQEILATRRFDGSLFIPSMDQYFFSLLFHATVHKKAVKPGYRDRLTHLAEALGFDWFDAQMLGSSEETAKLVGGFMSANQYFFETPVDTGVYQNVDIIKALPTPRFDRKKKSRGPFSRFAKSIRKRLPS